MSCVLVRGVGKCEVVGVRAAALVAVAAAAIGGVVALGGGNPSQDLRLLSGAAWLASSKVGQVTLLDGTSAEVSAQVQVATAGNLLEVVQQGSTAYAVDQTAGTVRRVDGATFAATDPQAPIADPTTAITAIPGSQSLYTLDARRGILADTDPRTLLRRGDMVTVAGELTEGTATVDDVGTFWAIDPATGRVSRVQGGKPSYVDNVTRPGTSRLTVANGHPVVVDQAGQKAVSLDRDTGQPTAEIPLSVRPDDKLQISGSPHNERVYVVAQRGVLNICELAEGDCTKTVPLGTDNDFGAAVETGNRLFVPNYSTGQVWIVDLGRSAVVAKADALKATGKFQLLTRDGLVFYNDTRSEKAGVITLSGEVTAVSKYDPADPAEGLTAAVSAPKAQETQVREPQAQAPQAEQPEQQQPAQPDNPQQQPQIPAAQDSASQLKITMSDTSPAVDQAVELKVENTSGAQPDRAQWTFGDGEAGEGMTTSHKWTAPGDPFQITVKAFFDAEQTEVPAAITITVSAKPLLRLAVAAPDGGKITGNGIDCPGTCQAELEPNTAVKLDTTPNPDRTASSWAGCPGANATTCQFVITEDKTDLSYTFGTAPVLVRLSVTPPANGSISGGGLNCPGRCTTEVAQNTSVTLATTPASGFTAGTWGGACVGSTGTACRITLTAPETVVSATFAEKPKFTLVVRGRTDSSSTTDGTITIQPGNLSCEIDCDQLAEIPQDTQVTLVAQPRDAQSVSTRFDRWEGPVCGGSQNPVCTFRMTGPVTVTAFFKGRLLPPVKR